MGSIWAFLLIWGVWLITPVIVDGVDAVSRLIIVRYRMRKTTRSRRLSDADVPTVAVIVPAHNEAAVIDRCLNSVKAQDYPHDKLEIVVIDDGSTDDTADRVEEHVNGNGSAPKNGNGSFRLRGKPIRVGPFRGTLALIKNGHQGKAHALNAGIEASTGEIVINIDSDVVLAPDAVRKIAEAFAADPEMGAATGNIEIDWEILEARDENGDLVLDDDGHIVPRQLSIMQRLIAKWQFLEYLSSFDLGRRAEALTKSMYTLAGACSAFRRSVLSPECCYTNTTVSEDTCLTFDLHRSGVQVGFVADAKVYLEPVVDWDSLYAQRVRWTRGQLEVCGLNEDIIGRRQHGVFGRLAVPKMLLLDHTLAFPRLIWAPLLLFFPMIGYSWRVVAIAMAAMYAFYLLLEVVNMLAVFAIADEQTKTRIERSIGSLAGMPLYRFIVFHFRFSGFLVTLKEEQQWTMPGPVSRTRSSLRKAALRSIEFASAVVGTLAIVYRAVGRAAQLSIVPVLAVITASLAQLLNSWNKRG